MTLNQLLYLGERTYLHPKNCLLLGQISLAEDRLDSAEEALTAY